MSNLPPLDRRKQQVLAAIVREYIQTAEPVSSQRVVQQHRVKASSATVRNDMAVLEESGYILQPHTSAGRIPSDRGYRYFVDQLMHRRRLAPRERDWLAQKYAHLQEEVDELLQETCRLLSRLTGYIAVALTPSLRETLLSYIQMAPVDRHRLLIVLVTDSGQVEHRLITVDRIPQPEMLLRMTRLLNAHLAGQPLSMIEQLELSQLWQEAGFYNQVLEQALTLLKTCLVGERSPQVFIDGTIYILDQPEFQDVSRAREVLTALQQGTVLQQTLEGRGGNPDLPVVVTIGSENPAPSLQGCSIATTSYVLPTGTRGHLGIVGPTRLRYGRVFQVLESIRGLLEHALQPPP